MNKSFSSNVKDELCEVKFNEKEAAAELAAMLLFGENIENGQFVLKTDRAQVAARIQAIYKKVMHEEVMIDIINGKRSYSVSIDKKTAEKTGIYISTDGEIALDEDIYEEDASKRAFLRGSFIISGTITNPQKEYSCELLTYNENMAYLASEILDSFNISANTVKRNNHFVTYLKDSSSVSDFLNIVGAHRLMMDFMVTVIEKDHNNRNNRVSICKTANLDKTLAASAVQQKAILKLQNSVKWDELDESTRRIALIRLKHFDLPLLAIGEMMDPPMTKSSVNRRMQRLIDLAEEL